jgi:hypothetical protein
MAEMRKCIGSATFGIAAHEARIEDFPRQPSQRDGLGRMCKTHWRLYTAGLARDRKAKAAAGAATTAIVKTAVAAPREGGGTTAALRKQVRATAKPPGKPEPIRTKAPRAKSSGEKIAASMAEATVARKGDAG